MRVSSSEVIAFDGAAARDNRYVQLGVTNYR